jgi:hypothetical protein
MKSPRRQARNRAPGKNPALGRFINARWLAPLRELAAVATPAPKGGVSPVGAEVADVLEAAEGSPYPTVPNLAAERFNRLAEQASLRFHAGPPVGGFPHPGVFIKPVPEVDVGIQTAEGPSVGTRGFWSFQLAYGYFMNPERDRLRRCAVCRRWFVDGTKNRSARRCSRACTIRWSNAQRHKGGSA